MTTGPVLFVARGAAGKVTTRARPAPALFTWGVTWRAAGAPVFRSRRPDSSPA
jgi:hypothetical protein